MLAEAERLRSEGTVLTQQAAALRAQAGELKREGAPPAPGSGAEATGADLKEQAAELQAEADAANQQKQRALRLQAELTNPHEGRWR